MVRVSESATIVITPATRERWEELIRVVSSVMEEFTRVMREVWSQLESMAEAVLGLLRGTEQLRYPGVTQGFVRRGTLRGLPPTPRLRR